MKLHALAFVGCVFLAIPARAASDEVLRAAYCVKVLDGELADDQSIASSFAKEFEQYRDVAGRRSLTAAERKRFANLQKFVELDEPKLRGLLTSARTRLMVYSMTNSDIVTGDASDALAITLAMKRGEADFAQCHAEMAGGSGFCLKACTSQCGADAPCFQACAPQCNAPACARSFPCINPTWLPY